MTGCRIGRVRLKYGATIVPLRQPERDHLQVKMVRHAKIIANGFEPNKISGFYVIAWDDRGHYRDGFALTAEGLIGPTMLPTWISDAVRRQLIDMGAWQL